MAFAGYPASSKETGANQRTGEQNRASVGTGGVRDLQHREISSRLQSLLLPYEKIERTRDAGRRARESKVQAPVVAVL